MERDILRFQLHAPSHVWFLDPRTFPQLTISFYHVVNDLFLSLILCQLIPNLKFEFQNLNLTKQYKK